MSSALYSILEDPVVHKALDFVDKVRMEFADDRDKYDEFLTILKDARNVTDLRAVDYVLMRPYEPLKPSYVARIEGIEADSQGANVKNHVGWFYWLEDSIGG
ncbi:hypothetical protein P8452_53116 [Trifolium repens]|nr:hypothetical protein P8452_53116 [Trifolium repens]